MDNICIGTAQFGMPYGIANTAGMPDGTEALKTVKTASSNKIYFYDTAPAYGMAESILGEVFEQANIQNDVCVVTKLRPDFSFSDYTSLKEEVLESRTRLRINSLWGFLMHRTTLQGDWKEFCRAIDRLKTEGAIKHFGVSVYHPEDALRFAQNPAIDIIQAPFNILDRRLTDNRFFEIAERKNKKVFIRSVFLQGLLLMKEEEIKKKHMSWALPFLTEVRRFAAQHDLDLKTFALSAVCRKVPWAKVIIGIETDKQLTQNINLIRSQEPTDPSIVETDGAWWDMLPAYPEKFLNPALWQ
jgi:aryl-alcohol dehydrogenase-like predicted oxidoreductase